MPSRLSRPLAILLALQLTACAGGEKRGEEAPAEAWALSGYLPEKTGEKVYVVMQEGRITAVSAVKPSLRKIIETTATIFPGFIDLNASLAAGALPLGEMVRGQYLHRAEWAERPSIYQRYERSTPGLGRPAEACAALRWSELRALTGGAALVRGVEPRALNCAEGFGVGNLESPRDLPEGRIYSEERPIPPLMMEKVFVPFLQPHREKGATYEQAFRKMLEDKRVTDWISRFRNDTHNLANALRLLTGRDFGFAPEAMSRELYERQAGSIEKFLVGPPYALSPAAARRQMDAMALWIFGEPEAEGGASAGYLKASREEASAYQYLAKEGVLTFDAPLRAYIGNFEPRTRAPALRALEATDTRAVFLSLGEGTRGNPYSAAEFRLAKSLGYLRPGTVILGGNAYGPAEFAELKASDISLVWSPFTELLLYGDSLSVKAARDAGLNIALGGGPASAGAKNLLDQLKIARAYLDRSGGAEITNRELVNMLTVNPAKALRLEDQLGAVKPGYLANLTLLQCSAAQDPWDCAVKAEVGKVALVVSGGQLRYGDEKLLEAAAEDGKLERMPLPPASGCNFHKSFLFSDGLRGSFSSLARLQESLRPAPADPEAKVKRKPAVPLGALFACEDPAYEERRENFVTEGLPKLRLEKANLRRRLKLPAAWNPLAGAK